MPYQVDPFSILSMTIESRVLQQQMLTVLHYILDSSAPLPDGFSAIQQFDGAVNDADKLVSTYADCCTTSMVGIKVKYQWITPLRFGYVTLPGIRATGQVGSPLLAPNLALAILRRSDRAGAGSTGTMHLPGLPVSFVTAGSPNGLAVSTTGPLIEQMLVEVPIGLGDGIMKPCIFHKAVPANSQQIFRCEMAQTVRTMHRRTVGVGS